MSHRHLTDTEAETAVLYALGALDALEAAGFEAHLAEGCDVCQREVASHRGVIDHLGYGAAPRRPRPELRERLRERLAAGGSPPIEVPAGGGEWEPLAARVTRKRLFEDRGTRRITALVRMEAGSRYPAHRHADTEQLLVLAGDLTVEGQALRPGDYCGATAGSAHGETFSEQGCTLLLLASTRSELEPVEGAAGPGRVVIVRAREGAWRPAGVDGVAFRQLFVDPVTGMVTRVVRMDPGARLPGHRHAGEEQLFLIDGEARLGGRLLRAGDYGRAPAGTVHEPAFTERGCSFLLVAASADIAF